jgi:hypothetical protein
MAKKIVRHELVSINIPAGSTLTRFNIPDLPNLRNVHTYGIQVYTDIQVTKDIISQNNVCNAVAVLNNSFITLVNYGGKEFLKQAPSIMFNTISANAALSTNQFDNNQKSFCGQKVNYPKSYIEFTAAPALPLANSAFIFSVYYSLPAAQEAMENGFTFNKKG